MVLFSLYDEIKDLKLSEKLDMHSLSHAEWLALQQLLFTDYKTVEQRKQSASAYRFCPHGMHTLPRMGSSEQASGAP